MKLKRTIKTLISTVPIFGLGILLLLAPCKVRNFIQAELGLEITKVSNLSQTNFNVAQSDCSILTNENLSAKKTSSNLHKQKVDHNGFACFIPSKTNVSTYKNVKPRSLKHPTKNPLYILQKGLLVYS
ncbi:hypothetical protein [Crocinitomix algicola]|uniref:hypothetical protein n=1 Tax=Crocinitomix algicola TaxID=1740263 RepID=UPI0008332D9F|nr:hypothetical protein [Crocinitomix algicola]